MNQLYLTFLTSLFCFSLCSQTHITWQTLADVTFQEIEAEAENIIYNQATFGSTLSQFKDKAVIVSGYMIPMDALGLSYALSRNPNSTCFFCGGAGPETVVQLKLVQMKRYRIDERVSFKGRLQLNEKDINSLTYVLLDAEPL